MESVSQSTSSGACAFPETSVAMEESQESAIRFGYFIKVVPEGSNEFIEAKIEREYALEQGGSFEESVKKLKVKLSEYPRFKYSSKKETPTEREIELIDRQRLRLMDLRFFHEPGKICRWFPVVAKTDDKLKHVRDELKICIPDGEIRRVLMSYDQCEQVIARLNSVSEIRCGWTPDQHCLLQQPGKQACVVACCEMIARDHSKRLPEYLLTGKNYITDIMLISYYFKQCNLVAESYNVPLHHTAADFEAVLDNVCTSIIVEFDGGLDAHVVILDKINKNYATIREPYHGMNVEVSSEYFCSQVGEKYFAIVKS